MRLIGVEHRVHDTFTARVGQKFGTVAEQAACRNLIFDVHTLALLLHVEQVTLALTHLFDDSAGEFVRNVDIDLFDRLHDNAVFFLENDVRGGQCHFIAFTAHVFHENGQVHFTASADTEFICGCTVGNAQGNVLEQFFVQTLTQMTGGDILAFLACKRRVIDGNGHFERRLGDLDKFQRLGSVVLADGITDGDVFTAGEADDIADGCFFYRNTAQTVDLIECLDSGALCLCVGIMVVADGDFFIDMKHTALNASDGDTTDIIVVVDGRNEHLQRTFVVTLGCGNVIENGLKQRLEVFGCFEGRVGSGTCTAGAPDHRRIELFVRCIELQKQFQHFVADFIQTCVGLVDLVDDDDNTVVELQRFLQNETGLRHRTFCCVNEQNNAVDHLENTFDLTAEVCVTGSVNDVDFRVFIVDCGVFCKNGNAAFALQVIGVHDAGRGFLVFTVDAALLEQTVNQRGFAVVNVCDDGYVS